MGEPADMVAQAESLLERGFDTLKLKVGHWISKGNWNASKPSGPWLLADKVTLRLDANGGLDDEDPSP